MYRKESTIKKKKNPKAYDYNDKCTEKSRTIKKEKLKNY